jgi:NagD protein
MRTDATAACWPAETIIGAMDIHASFHKWFHLHRAEYDALVLDVDGVLIAGTTVMAGAVELLQELRAAAFPVALLTNDGNHSVAEKAAFLARCGFDFAESEITSCADGLVEVVQQRGLAGRPVFILGDLGRPCFAGKAGLCPTCDLDRLDDCAAVIVGEGLYDWQRTLNAVVNSFLRCPQRPLIVPNPDEYYPGHGGKIVIAAGGVGRFLHQVLPVYGTPPELLYLGKPYQPIFQHSHAAMERRLGHRVTRERVLMLGDSLASDVKGAREFGYRPALVLTGITREQHLGRAIPEPDLVFRRF